MTSIHQLALSNVDRHIAAAEQAGQHLSPDEQEQLYADCLAIAEKERNGTYFIKKDSLVLIKGTHEGGLVDNVAGDTAWLVMVKRPGEKVPVKLSELELV